MKRSVIYVICILIAGCLSAQAQDVPSMKTLKILLQANRYFLEKWPDPGKPVDNDIQSNTWTRSVYYEGLMALYKINPNQVLLDHALRWGQFHKWDMPGGIGTRAPEDQCCGQTYIDLYMLDRYKEERIKQIRACIDNMIATEKIDDWKSTDALQMSMPVFARLGKVYNDEKYYGRMHGMYMYTKTKHDGNGLYNPEEQLWWRDGNSAGSCKESGGVDCFRAEGNGWVVAALVRTLEFLPNNSRHRKEYETTLREMFEALAPLQREDGFWNVSLKDPGNSPGKELTGTSLFVYGMAWGINEGLINKKEYLPVATRAWEAILEDCVHPDGSLAYAEYGPGSEDVGLGCFLLAGSEMYKLLKSMEPKEKVKKEKEEKPVKEKRKKTRD